MLKFWREERRDFYIDWEITVERDNVTAEVTTHYPYGGGLHYAYVISKNGDQYVQQEIQQHTSVFYEDVIDGEIGKRMLAKVIEWVNQARNHTKDVSTAIVGVQLLFQYKRRLPSFQMDKESPRSNNLALWGLEDIRKFINSKRGKIKQ